MTSLPPWFVIKVTAIASLGGCLFGYDMGAITGALPQLQTSFELTDSQAEWVVSILYLGGGFGAMIGGTLCDIAGRRRTILGTDVVFMLGAIWLYFCNSYESIILGRFVVGVGVAVSGIADVSYLHEIAPIEWRGSIVSVNEACISLGFLLAYVSGYFFSNNDNDEWRIIFGLAGLLAFIQFIGMIKLPESPIWLASKGRIHESRLAFQKINCGRQQTTIDDNNINQQQQSPSPTTTTSTTMDDDVVVDQGRRESIQNYQEISIDEDDKQSSVLYHFKSAGSIISKFRRQIYISLFLSTTQQFCGQANVLNYAPYIFAEAADEEGPPAWSTLTIGFVKFLVTVLVIWRIESIGRRNLLLIGMSLISIGLLALIIAFGGSNNDPDSWSNLKGFELALPGVLSVVCGYSMSFGPLQWLLTSELFPTEIRGRALGVSTIVTYLCASLVTRTFLSAQTALGPSKVFAIYCLINTIGIIFAYLAIPDTGEQTVEQIEVSLRRMWWWRFDSISLYQSEEQELVTLQNRNTSPDGGNTTSYSDLVIT